MIPKAGYVYIAMIIIGEALCGENAGRYQKTDRSHMGNGCIEQTNRLGAIFQNHPTLTFTTSFITTIKPYINTKLKW